MKVFLSLLLEAIIAYALVFILYFFLFVFKKTKYNENKVPVEYYYLISVYKLDQKKINYKRFIYLSAFLNSFIIVITYMIVFHLLSKWIVRLLVGIVIIVLLIIITYGLLGRYYQKRCKKNV